MRKDDSGAAQLKAYENRDKLQIGDAFAWHFAEGYGTSGKLPRKYMPVSEGWDGDRTLRICRVYEGRNGYGPFVDYWLNADGVYKGTAKGCLIINGPDAFKMGRAKT